MTATTRSRSKSPRMGIPPNLIQSSFDSIDSSQADYCHRSPREIIVSCLNRCVPGLFSLFMSMMVTKIAGNASFNSDSNMGESLKDVIHSRVPEHWNHTDPLSAFYQAPDRLLLASVVATTLMIAVKAPSVNDVCGIVGEVSSLLAVLFCLRSSIIVSTTIPTPVRSCLGAKSLEDAQSGFAAAETYCNDLMFSGHTAFHTVLGSVWAASPTPTSLRIAMTCYILGSIFVSVAVKDHYTMDVLVSLYVSIPLCLLRRPNMIQLFGFSTGWGQKDISQNGDRVSSSRSPQFKNL